MEQELDQEQEYRDITKSVGFKVAQDLADFTNPFGHKPDDFIAGFLYQHRTLQQNSFRVILKLIEFMATPAYRTDPRNQASKDVAIKLNDAAIKLLEVFNNEYYKELLSKGVSETEAKKYVGEFFQPSAFLSYI